MILRARESDWTPFANRLRERADVETAGFVLAERLRGGEVLLAKHFVVVPESGYQIRKRDQLRIDPIAINRIVRQARDESLSVFTVHTHPGTSEPWFSAADDAGDSRLMPSLFSQTTGPHGSLVLAGETGISIGRTFTEHGASHTLSVRIVGSEIQMFGAAEAKGTGAEWFDRQRLALGDHGQEIIQKLRVGVVGLGGTGSVAFAQLVHLGVGDIVAMDGDLVDATNLSRIIGATINDIGATPKVEVARRYAKSVGMNSLVDVKQGRLGQEFSVADLEDCDVVLSCVDRHTPRSLLNRLSYARAVPVIDMGSAFRVGQDGAIVGSAGRVVVIGPEKPCLACWGHIDANRLRIEALPQAEREREVAEGYISGASAPQPSVIAFNAMIAGSAVIELLRLVTSFAGAQSPPTRLAFDFGEGTVRRNKLSLTEACAICRS